jgi:hypothetical protein
MLAVVLVCQPAVAPADDDDAGWSSDHYVPREQWKESAVEIPRWPEQDDLLEVSMGRAGFPFRVYTDPESLTIGDDGVVRYVLVIVSSSGAWNASFEASCATRENTGVMPMDQASSGTSLPVQPGSASSRTARTPIATHCTGTTCVMRKATILVCRI